MKNKKKVILILIFFEIIIGLISLELNVKGFNNGNVQGHFREGTFNPNYATQSEIQDWYKNCYGTHDWIAEAALKAILADQTASSKWIGEDTIFWTETRKIIFYIGTEAPDTTDNSRAPAYTHLILNNIPCDGMLVKTNMYFHADDGSVNRMRPRSYPKFVTDCNIWTYKAMKYLREGKCDAVAFYMGAITHLIADMASWPHVLYWKDVTPEDESSNLGKLHGDYEKQVNLVTRYHFDMEKPDGFNYPKNFPILSYEPVLTLKVIAFNTYWDYDISLIDIQKIPFPTYITPGEYPATKQYAVYGSLCFGESVNKWSSPFKNRVQENLNKAVKFSAYAIDFIADAWAQGDNPKFCEECSKNNDPNQDLGLKKGTKVLRGLSLILILGIVNIYFSPYLVIVEHAIIAS
jgi:hypothetical protein